jgi:hypothetical protein
MNREKLYPVETVLIASLLKCEDSEKVFISVNWVNMKIIIIKHKLAPSITILNKTLLA